MQQDSNSCVQFFLRDGLLYRSWSPKGSQPGDIRSCEQLVLPQLCRELVMRLSHDVPMAVHLGITKMKDRILQRYYWPGIFKDVAKYCRGCEVCQRSTPRKPAKAGLVPIPIVTCPFQRIRMDIVGPLEDPAPNPEIEESNCVSLSPEQKGQLQSLLGEFPCVVCTIIKV